MNEPESGGNLCQGWGRNPLINHVYVHINNQNDHSKNLQEASNNWGQKQSKIKTEVTELINFIQ